jgi:glycosyltransferase involved in cell wall biosynthesis
LQSLFYSALDVFVLPSFAESFGQTALESMACGTPVIAFKTSALPEVVADDETGLLEAQIGSVAGLTRRIKWFIEHPCECGNMGRAARVRVEKLFNIDLMAQRYIRLYLSLLKPGE